MIDIKLIRENSEIVKENCKNRGYDEKLVNTIIQLDKEWRDLKKIDDDLRSERNAVSEKINLAKKQGEKAEDLIKKAKEIPEKLVKNEEKENKLRQEIDALLSSLPNIQKEDVPIGDGTKNKIVKESGKILKIKNAKTHLELGEKLDILDIKRATKISGAGFYILKGKGAKLQRALIQFMLDSHEKNGFLEINPPQLVNRKTAFGTGNLPKFEDQLYKTNDDMMLIPTAEVPVTNIYSDEVLAEKELPKRFCAFTECYRTEAGRRAGEEGLFRLHQFEKVEMVYICKPEESWQMLEEMTKNAEKILEMLEIPYRRLLLATADAGFASAKTYDLEVFAPGTGRWLETSSCSNCTDFQARRMNTKYQSKEGIKFVHTLNGSGLALPRIMIALMENNQQEDGSIKIPKALWKYTGFKEINTSEKKAGEKKSDKKNKN
ncbi:serine--tRNA ligase [Candidatus Pacearchaeota archaeon]|nr:serine--tRNA ligase [Candidatus Pacearchaeota archaeon]